MKFARIQHRRIVRPASCTIAPPSCGEQWKSVTRYALLLMAMTVCCVCGVGCGRSERLNIEYGSRRGGGLTSVNGTIVLSELFRQQGHRVSSWGRLSPKLNKEEVIVWAPDRYGAPTARERDYLEQWLAAEPGRTLIYVGRDYDAHLQYWQSIVASTPPGARRLRARQQLAHEKADKNSDRQAELGRTIECPWFAFRADQPESLVTKVEGPWAFGMYSTQVNIQTYRRLVMDVELEPDVKNGAATQSSPSEATATSATPRNAGSAEITAQNLQIEWETTNPVGSRKTRSVTPLLRSNDGQLLAAELQASDWANSRIIVVANGSWLLNYPLLHPVHRQLAMNLVAEIRNTSDVCFLESGVDELTITDSDANVPLALQAFQVFPINLLVIQLLAVGILYCFCVFPIFGRPRSIPSEQLTDFGKHVTAVGEMLERNQHLGYAKARIQQYYDLVNPRSKS